MFILNTSAKQPYFNEVEVNDWCVSKSNLSVVSQRPTSSSTNERAIHGAHLYLILFVWQWVLEETKPAEFDKSLIKCMCDTCCDCQLVLFSLWQAYRAYYLKILYQVLPHLYNILRHPAGTRITFCSLLLAGKWNASCTILTLQID